jgi:hypothetical protein
VSADDCTKTAAAAQTAHAATELNNARQCQRLGFPANLALSTTSQEKLVPKTRSLV